MYWILPLSLLVKHFNKLLPYLIVAFGITKLHNATCVSAKATANEREDFLRNNFKNVFLKMVVHPK